MFTSDKKEVKDFEYMLWDLELEDLIKQYQHMKAEVDFYSKRLNAIRALVHEKMGNHEYVCDKNGEVVASFKKIETTYFDKEQFRTEHPELFERYCSTASHLRLNVKKDGELLEFYDKDI